MLNQVTIMGRITRDLELRRTNGGTAVCSFTVAVDRDYSKDGNRETDFIDVQSWRQTAEFVSKHFAKGRMIVVTGSLQSRRWEGRDGSTHVAWEVVADNVYFGDSKSDGQRAAGKPASKPVGVEFDEIEDSDSDEPLPF